MGRNAETDLQQDYQHFLNLWEHKKNPHNKHTVERWDNIAAEWEHELNPQNIFYREHRERVIAFCDYLRKRGALNATAKVLDIGCGPGLFVTELAQTAAQVTGMDISPRMLEVAAKQAKLAQRTNVSFIARDFRQLDLSDKELGAPYDLVFSCNSPAFVSADGLNKVMQLSKGFCFNSCFIKWEDSIERQICENLLQKPYLPTHSRQDRSFYALYNLLWLSGYYPETTYYKYHRQEQVTVNEKLAQAYTAQIALSLPLKEQDQQRIYQYLQSIASPQNSIEREISKEYGCVLWDIRDKSARSWMK